eukprot:5324336-Pyramimonas_sp.AAC.1
MFAQSSPKSTAILVDRRFVSSRSAAFVFAAVVATWNLKQLAYNSSSSSSSRVSTSPLPAAASKRARRSAGASAGTATRARRAGNETRGTSHKAGSR